MVSLPDVHGAVLVDKPRGSTSAGVLRTLERAWGRRGLGHAGTLDPMATGLLVVLSGAATRLQALFLHAEKVYSGVIRIGVGTSTDDIEGEVIAADSELRFRDERTLAEWREAICERFSGRQLQVPPRYSAVKVAGRRSYELARRGKEAELSPREVHIKFEELELESAERLRYTIRCSKGTYVRSLARDIGGFLGAPACLESIRRIASGSFDVSRAQPLDAVLSDPGRYLIGMDELVAGLPAFCFDEPDCRRLKQGDQLPLLRSAPHRDGAGRLAAIFSHDGTFQGMAEQPEDNPSWKVRFLLP